MSEINGTSADDVLVGTGGADVIRGDAGNDVLFGAGGPDYMEGGLGNDAYFVDSALDNVIEPATIGGLDAGHDVVFVSAAYYALSYTASIEELVAYDVPASTDLELHGSAIGQYLEGHSGRDLLDGGEGADVLNGLGGDDIYWFDNRYDVAIEHDGGGYDRIYTIASIPLPEECFVEEVIAQWKSQSPPPVFSFLGNAQKNLLQGLSNNDTLYGAGGDDRLIGLGGDDWLEGGAGADVMEGGAGDDHYEVDSLLDAVVEAAGEGRDVVAVSGSAFALAPDCEVEEMRPSDLVSYAPLSLTGNDFAQEIIGNYGDNRLSGGGGNDRLYGRAGNDQLDGGAGDDLLDGGTGDDRIAGGDGRDVFRLEGGGDEIVSGEGGVDSFYFGSEFDARDRVDGGGDRDSILLQGDYSAGATFGTGDVSNISDIEGISLLSGLNPAYGDTSGNLYSYRLTMLDSNVAAGALMKVNGFNLAPGEAFRFDGSAETDAPLQVFGGRGTDALVGGQQGDAFIFGHDGRFQLGDTVDGRGGYDVVYFRGDYFIDFNAAGFAGSLVNIESIALLTSANTEFAGGGDGDFDYMLVWNDNMLAAGATLTVNGSRLQSHETFIFDGSGERDGALRLFGGGATDTLASGGGNDQLHGGGGADVLAGGAGADLYRYSATTDSAPGAFDTINGFQHGIDRIDLNRVDAKAATVEVNEAFAFIGAAAFTAAGPNAPGEARAFNVAGDLWQVEGDVNGDGVADLVIQVHVDAGQPLTAPDFIL